MKRIVQFRNKSRFPEWTFQCNLREGADEGAVLRIFRAVSKNEYRIVNEDGTE